MVVCMSRRICVELYQAITRLAPSGTMMLTTRVPSRS